MQSITQGTQGCPSLLLCTDGTRSSGSPADASTSILLGAMKIVYPVR